MPDDALDSFNKNGLAWAVSVWERAVKYCPMVNVQRRAMDSILRETIRYFGGDPDKLIGPSHDALRDAAKNGPATLSEQEGA